MEGLSKGVTSHDFTFIKDLLSWMGREQEGSRSGPHERQGSHRVGVVKMERSGSIWDVFWSWNPPQGN